MRVSATVFPSDTSDLTAYIAFSITLFPDVLAVMSSPSSMGTPLLTSVPRVLVNFAIAVFCRRTPKIGRCRRILSVTYLPFSVLLIWTIKIAMAIITPNTTIPPIPLRKSLIATTIRVGSGSVPPNWANICVKVGTT
ncbi:hypothetical protein BMS3Bbin07_00939 [bacterium BMS3Bbin07]|nr:hypothetical protein BMS3Bbin07_00939 [bacterium BMS3Bbin07]